MRRPLLFICVCLFVLIAVYMHLFSPPPWDRVYPVDTGEEVYIDGQVYKKEYGLKEGREIVVLYLQNVLISRESMDFRHTSVQEEVINISDKKIMCEIYVSDLPYLEEDEVYLPCLGEAVSVSGEWRNFSNATNPGEFNQANYYAIEGIAGKVVNVKILSKSGAVWILRESLCNLRQSLVKRLYELFDDREASILAKMLLGDGSGLDPEIRELYQENGIVHILSISGLHISLLGMVCYSLLRKMHMPLRGAAVTGAVFIVLYGMLTGFSVSACRAIGMYLIHMLGEVWRKTYDMLTAMGVLLVGLLLRTPRLVYHSGFLLSFASVCGVGLLSPILLKGKWIIRPYDSNIRKWTKRRVEKIRAGFSVSLAVTIFTLPLQLFFFYQIPIFSVFLNLLVIPFVGVAMVVGLLVLIFPGFSFLTPIEHFIFEWFEGCCLFFEKIPGHTLLIGRPAFWKIIVYYVGVLTGILWGKRLKRRGVLGICILVCLLLTVRIRHEEKITFLDVGQGDCICVQTQDGRCFLFDGGSGSKISVGDRIILPYLQQEGIHTLDGVFLSHPDADHINGIVQLLQDDDICIKTIFLPQVNKAEDEFAEILEYTDRTKMQYVSSGMSVSLPDVKIICVHPPKGFVGEDNSFSACYYLKLNQMTVLLTGDVEGEGEQALAEELKKLEIRNVDILKVAHHGSRYSTSEVLLEQIKPKLAVISCGRNNRYGHPHEETLERLARAGSVVMTTPQYGAVMIEAASDERITISYGRKDLITD